MNYRLAHQVRIHCPVSAETLAAIHAGNASAIERDATAAAMLAILRDETPLGRFGTYHGVCETGAGIESFIPGTASQPAEGSAGTISHSATLVMTTWYASDADPAAVAAALARIMAAHPWEVPVVEVSDKPVRLLVRV